MARLRIPEVLTPTEREALLRVPNPRYPTGERNRLLLRVMLNAGLRLSEALNLRWPDVDLNTGRLHVKRGKGGKDRVLWLGEEDLAALRKWRQRQAALTPRGQRRRGSLPPSWVPIVISRVVGQVSLFRPI